MPPARTPWEPRFWVKVVKSDGCWFWIGHRANGYGRFRKNYDGPSEAAHRVAYELLVGPVPAGHDLDHLCRHRECVNPTHLEPVTRSVNTRRGRSGEWDRGTHCKQGHLLTGANVYERQDRHRKDGTPQRECVTCRNDATAKWREKKENRG